VAPALGLMAGVDSTRSIGAWEHAKHRVSRTLDLRQFADVPVPSEGLDQQNTRIELAPPDINVILFVRLGIADESVRAVVMGLQSVAESP
jgi:hypothetical protein